MCNNCNNVILRDCFYSPKDYINCLEYIKELLNTGNYKLVEKTCDIDKIMDENGHWVDDIISHVIKCKNCGKHFTCSVDTYHGHGGFRKGR